VAGGPGVGEEWVVDARGCAPEALSDLGVLGALFDAMIAGLALRPVGDTVWHRFPGAGGVTGVVLLAESHLACHTFPEHGSICLNLFCCRPRPAWDFDGELRRRLGAGAVRVRRLERAYAAAALEPAAARGP
jgi:S-adenosylmethionine decarboxylase